jgi:broad specificity phosphatase PhoE
MGDVRTEDEQAEEEPTMWDRARARRRRFLDRYEQRRAEQHHVLVRPLRITLGVLLLVISPIVGAIPGPGGVFVFLPGAFLLASEYRRAALIMDRMEHETIPRLRRLHARLRGGPKPEWYEQDPELWGAWCDRRGMDAPDSGERRRDSDSDLA